MTEGGLEISKIMLPQHRSGLYNDLIHVQILRLIISHPMGLLLGENIRKKTTQI